MRILALKSKIVYSLLLICLILTAVNAEDNIDLPACSGTLEKLVATGNELWLKRSIEPPQSAISRRRLELSVECFQKALENEPKNQNIRFKLIESLYFLGHFIYTDQKEKEDTFQKALDHSKESLEQLKVLSSQANLFSLNLKQQAEILKTLPDSPQALFWASITWGLWGMTFGDFKSAMNDVAGKCAQYSQLLILVDPNFADAGGYRLLGRLHTIVPRIPLFTFWVDRQKGIDLLYHAVNISTKDLRNEYFLADALLKYEPSKIKFALELLYKISNTKVQGEYLIEELETINQTKALLQELNK